MGLRGEVDAAAAPQNYQVVEVTGDPFEHAGRRTKHAHEAICDDVLGRGELPDRWRGAGTLTLYPRVVRPQVRILRRVRPVGAQFVPALPQQLVGEGAERAPKRRASRKADQVGQLPGRALLRLDLVEHGRPVPVGVVHRAPLRQLQRPRRRPVRVSDAQLAMRLGQQNVQQVTADMAHPDPWYTP